MKLLAVPYRFLLPVALFFIAIGIYGVNSSLFEVLEVLFFGIVGAIFIVLNFPVAPVVLGFVLGPLVEKNFRRALVVAHGNMLVFVERPVSLAFIGICFLLVVSKLVVGVRRLLQAQQRHSVTKGPARNAVSDP